MAVPGDAAGGSDMRLSSHSGAGRATATRRDRHARAGSAGHVAAVIAGLASDRATTAPGRDIAGMPGDDA